jgi:hypothetical protein
VEKPVSKFAFQVHNLQRYSVNATTTTTAAGDSTKTVVNLAVLDVPSVMRTHDAACGAFDWRLAEGLRADAGLRGLESILRALDRKGRTAVVGVAGSSTGEDFELEMAAVVLQQSDATSVVVGAFHVSWRLFGPVCQRIEKMKP